jgi:hypothetical protein
MRHHIDAPGSRIIAHVFDRHSSDLVHDGLSYLRVQQRRSITVVGDETQFHQGCHASKLSTTRSVRCLIFRFVIFVTLTNASCSVCASALSSAFLNNTSSPFALSSSKSFGTLGGMRRRRSWPGSRLSAHHQRPKVRNSENCFGPSLNRRGSAGDSGSSFIALPSREHLEQAEQSAERNSFNQTCVRDFGQRGSRKMGQRIVPRRS